MKPGDKVTIKDYYEGPIYIGVIKSASKTLVTLTDGSQWHVPIGRPKGTNGLRFYRGNVLTEYEPKHEDIIQRKRIIRDLANFDWSTLTDSQLYTIASTIRLAIPSHPCHAP